MKINFILPFKRMTGGIKVVYIYANYLVDQGHDVVCYVPMVSYKGKDQSIFYRVKASLGNTIKKERWFEKQFKLQLVPIISEKFIRDADITIATAWQTAYDVNQFSEKKGKKFYFVQDFETFNGKQREVENSYKLPLTLITVTNSLKKKLKEFNSKKIHVVYNGLFDEDYFHGEKLRSPLPVLLMMYHESEHKKTQDGLEVIRRVKEKYPEIVVNIFGRRIPEKLPDSYNVLINPPREKIFKMYRESDIYLFTSEIESWGLPVVESMANKVAVIGRNRGALAELYNGNNATLFETVDELYDLIITLINERNTLQRLQLEGYETVKKLNWAESSSRFMNIIFNGNKNE
ncbi:TPA: glycosyltransferase family 4 protein [Streptococcus suis 2524]|uniref:Glycosyltransferase n=1 Tax=Streptococcus suis TaxID=1307 RepID=M1VNT6_STRSU|nr:glycosyltransferase family 4 protein [Streptococcus suis]RRR30760.1 glycosyltransferase [Streptococcus suis]RRR37950.1 glycosyltransferase [Streptococcus suis]RRR53025.1 glycosyltransferase [Streptococcus suis]RRR58000.1 glycosyltransferase [Streptococcus suis]BAM94552.1 glycosyltransferase [Streptococcus suis]